MLFSRKCKILLIYLDSESGLNLFTKELEANEIYSIYTAKFCRCKGKHSFSPQPRRLVWTVLAKTVNFVYKMFHSFCTVCIISTDWLKLDLELVALPEHMSISPEVTLMIRNLVLMFTKTTATKLVKCAFSTVAMKRKQWEKKRGYILGI